MAECYLLTDDGGRVTVKRIRKDSKGHWVEFGKMDLYDLPIREIRMAIDIQKVVEMYRSKK